MMNEATSMQETFEDIMMNIVLIFTSYYTYTDQNEFRN